MKFLLLVLMSASIAKADVDYVAIGKLVRDSNESVSNGKSSAACLINTYDGSTEDVCKKLEKLNGDFNQLRSKHTETIYCSGANAVSVGYIRFSSNLMRTLAKDAQPTDPIWVVIEKFEKSLAMYETELVEILRKAGVQELYVAQCLLGITPPNDSIRDVLCK